MASAANQLTRLTRQDSADEARALIARRFLMVSAVVFALAALMLATTGLKITYRPLVVACFAAGSLVSVWALRWRGEAAQRAVLGVNVGALLLVGFYAQRSGLGLNAPVIAFATLLPMVLCAAVSVRAGVFATAISVGLLMLLAWQEQTGVIGGAALLPNLSVPRRLVNHMLLTGAGLACGVMLAHAMAIHRRASEQREARYRDLFEVSPLALVVHRDWHVIDANAAAVALFGFADLATMKQHVLLEHLESDKHALARQRMLAARAGERLPPTVYRARTHDGRPVVLRATAIRLSADPDAVLSIFDDISELQEAQDALLRSQTTLSHLVATSPDLITLTDLETGCYVMVNDTFTRISGYSREEAIGRTALELGIWTNPDQRAAFVAALRERGTVADWPQQFAARSGERFSLLLSAAQFELEGRKYLVLNGRDISETERTRLAHEAVLQNASLGIAFTREQKFVQANPALEQMLGWVPGTLTGQPGRVVWGSDAEYAEIGTTIGPDLARGESVEFVRELRRRDGSVFWCRMLAKAVDPRHPMAGGTIWIVEDITERRRTEQALAKARDDAEAANRAKSAFLANTSHEIRTPLNGLVGLARLARRPEVDETRRRQYLDQIGDSAETLTAVISDVLDLSKIEAGHMLIDAVAFDLASLLDSLGRVYGTLADARGLIYEQTIESALPRRALGDPVRLRQILTNYLNNALKFTRDGRIGFAASVPRRGWLRVEVSDTGPGIDAAVQPQLFTPFMQADQSTTRRFGGTGLGLSICRELAHLMHGDVGVRSRIGEGSTFWVELPLPAAASQDPDTGFGIEAEDNPLVGARVLMAEDNAVNMTIAVAMLEQWGVVVSQASDGAQALDAVAQAERAGRPFDAVLMDVQMPVMSGYEATRLLRERHDPETLPIIALTAAALTSERELALDAGMNDFLTKPIDAQRLRETLGATLEARRAARHALG